MGNYFWTHYFYHVLQAKYTFPVEIQLNDVPFFLYLVTHGYFAFYFTCSTILIRKFRTSFTFGSGTVSLLANSALIFLMSVFTAFMETYTISEVDFHVSVFPVQAFTEQKI